MKDQFGIHNATVKKKYSTHTTFKNPLKGKRICKLFEIEKKVYLERKEREQNVCFRDITMTTKNYNPKITFYFLE